MKSFRVLTLVLGAWLAVTTLQASAAGSTITLPAIETTTVEALDGSNELRTSDGGYVILTEIPLRQVDPGAASWDFGKSGSLPVDYQIGSLDGDPLFVRISVPKSDYRSLSEDLISSPDPGHDFELLLESAAAATGMAALKCENGRQCVKTCSISGRMACCKYQCL